MAGQGDDHDLWAHVTRTVTPLRKRKPLGARAARPDKDEQSAAPAPPEKPPKKRRGRVPAAPQPKPAPPRPVPALAPGAAPGLDRRNAMRLRRGQLPIEGRIDLHGMTVDEAGTALRRFLMMARAQGKRCVLVITGKGTRGPGGEGGAIRRELPLWLNGPGLRPLVVAFAQAHAKDGGSGAFYVYLRRERGIKRGRHG